VEPFAGTLAVLLGRPTEPKIETVNDLDVLISNFWRSLQHDPEALAAHADWPVNECVPSGTLISTPSGDVPVEQIKVGMTVLGESGGHLVESLVLGTTISTALDLVGIGDLRLTRNHPVWTLENGYVEADKVCHGMHVRCITETDEESSLGDIPVSDPHRLPLQGKALNVHNFQTTTGNYFADRILVHNCDLHARHLWLVNRTGFRERMKTDPDYYDVQIAGWWVWGICQWIGSGWCATRGGEGRQDPPGDPWRKIPNIADGGRGLHRNVTAHVRPALNETSGIANKRPYLTNHGGGMGVHRPNLITPGRTNAGRSPRGIFGETARKRPRLGNDHGRGALNAQIPNLSGDSGAAGRGIHASGVSQQMPVLGRRQGAGVHRKMPQLCPGGHASSTHGKGVFSDEAESGLYRWFYDLADRLRRVRVCCGDWQRILGPAPTTCIGTTGVFLDPPYAIEERADVYGEESRDVAHAVREWAVANGDNPELRIALCGYEAPDYPMPATWTEIAWKANGGYANQANQKTRGRQNAHRERIWFSPFCLNPQGSLFTDE
jgi:hypothetical protein